MGKHSEHSKTLSQNGRTHDFQRHNHSNHVIKNKVTGFANTHNQKANTMVDEVPLLPTTPLGLLLELEVSVHVFFWSCPHLWIWTTHVAAYQLECIHWAPSKDKSNRMQMKKMLTLVIRKSQLQLIRRRNVKLRPFYFFLNLVHLRHRSQVNHWTLSLYDCW